MYYACNTRITTYYSRLPPAACRLPPVKLTPVGRVKGGNTTAVHAMGNGEDDKRAANIDDIRKPIAIRGSACYNLLTVNHTEYNKNRRRCFSGSLQRQTGR